ncbi:MAG TPA: SDR family oxidoreductase [Actinobacteria bacterium]|nr:SDR family oxidoreductase [Actinomycetota bacterium]HDL50042.1 SDR family oxidoreductase [Actinomycetota bacterium]
MASDTAIISGASGGIGSAVATRLAARGIAVGLLDLDPEPSTAAAAKITSNGGTAWAGPLDTTDPESIERALDLVEGALGPVSYVVTAAGVIKKAPFLGLGVDAWNRTIGVNLTGTWLVMQRVARRMVDAGRSGAFVAVSSVSGRSGRANAADYAASKAGVISIVRSAAQALAPHGIRVNGVCPGVVDTAMTDAIHEQTAAELGITREESIARMLAMVPLGRIETPEEVAAVIAFLLSEDAGYVTGQTLNVCGGMEFD